MITVSQLAAFDPTTWNSVADWARTMGKTSTKTQKELEAQATAVEKAWPSFVGQLAAAALRDQAASHGELATSYDDAATVIDDTTTGMTDLRTQIEALQKQVAGTPHLEGPDDAGVVTSNYPFSLGKIIDYLQSLTQARQLT
jgi:hypothetical protein